MWLRQLKENIVEKTANTECTPKCRSKREKYRQLMTVTLRVSKRNTVNL